MLRLENITVGFGGLTALANVTLEVGARELVGLVGPNGAGKTTLFNVISGLARPKAGTASFNSVNLLRKPVQARARIGIARTFQIPQPLHELTVRQNLIVAQTFGAGHRNARRIDEILDFIGLKRKAEENAADGLALSEHKALEVGKALATEPKLILLDEVLAGLETAGKRQFMQTLKRMHQEAGLAIIIIEHDIETILALCQRAVVLDFGKVIADQTPEEIFRNPAVMRSYTGATPGA
ncbi:MAG: ABC transporter ATP-binding protein [Bradyrhizobiaceae bacterium]|nr:ABC transporter ATP-binding protein [Bradyrhizobiaceae bacterium]